MVKTKIKSTIILMILLLNTLSNTYSQSKKPTIFSPLFNLEDNINILNDSVLLNGYLVFEFNKKSKILGFDNTNNYFTFIVYCVLDLEDLKSPNSIKFYYNSNKVQYGFYAFSENPKSDTFRYNDKLKFIRIYELYLENSKSENKPFMIEKLDFDMFSKNQIDFLQYDTLNNSGYFIFRFRVPAFLYTAQTNNIFNETDLDNYKINLLFFEPLREAIILDPLDKSVILSKGFSINKWISDYMDH